jgi:hypothetical protein
VSVDGEKIAVVTRMSRTVIGQGRPIYAYHWSLLQPFSSQGTAVISVADSCCCGPGETLLPCTSASTVKLRDLIPGTSKIFLSPANRLQCFWGHAQPCINHLTPDDLQRRRAVNHLKIKIPSKNMREKPTNTTIIHSVY